MSNFERFTERARQVVILAQEEAKMLAHNYIGTEHLLLGLIREEETVAARALTQLGLELGPLRRQVARIVGRGDEVTTGQIPFTPRSKKVLDLALREALSLGHNYICTEHILLGLVREGTEGVAVRILLDHDLDAEAVREAIIHELVGDTAADKRKKANAERWAEYQVCKVRGHTPSGFVTASVPPKATCRYCKTLFWTETVERESNAPVDPEGKS